MKQISCLLLACTLMVFTSCLKDSGTATVTYQKAIANYVDLEEVRNQSLLAGPATIDNAGKIYIGEDFILLGEEQKGIHVIDNSNESNPQNVSFINIPGNREFFVDGNFIYAESYYDFLKIDITNLNNPILLSRAENSIAEPSLDADGKALSGFDFTEVTEEIEIGSYEYHEIQNANNFLYYNYLNEIIPASAIPTSFAGNSGGQSGTVNRIALADDHIFLIDKQKISVFSNNSNDIEFLNETWIGNGGELETIFAHNEHLFLGSSNSMDIVNIDTPTQPRTIESFSHATACDPVLPKGDIAYVTLRTGIFDRPCEGTTNSLITLDVSNVFDANVLSEIDMESPYGMAISNDRLYVGEGANGLKIFDVTDPKAPSLIKSDAAIEAYDIIAHPTQANLIMIAGPNGLDQYSLNNDLGFNLESSIKF